MPNIRDIVGMGIDSKNNVCFAWYQDGTVSAGSSRDLGLGASAGPPLVPKTGPSAPGAQRIGRVQSAVQVHNVTETPHAGARAARGWT